MRLPEPAARRRFQRRLLRWYAVHGRDLPWRHSRDPYRVLVSEIMLQQTQVDRVIPKYHEFLERYPTFERLARARRQRLFWELAEALVPPGRAYDFNQALMDFGATWCTPRTPRCGVCPMRGFCRSAGDPR